MVGSLSMEKRISFYGITIKLLLIICYLFTEDYSSNIENPCMARGYVIYCKESLNINYSRQPRFCFGTIIKWKNLNYLSTCQKDDCIVGWKF